MPYELKKEGAQWCVYNKATGAKNGCSDTRAMALGMMRRLYQVESKGAKSFDSYDLYEHQVNPEQANYNPMGGMGGDKACANCQWFDSPDGCMLVSGDVSPTGLSDLWRAIIPDPTQSAVPVSVSNWDEMPATTGSKSSITEAAQGVKTWIDSLFNRGGNSSVVSAAAKGLRPIYVQDTPEGLRATLLMSNNFKDRHDQIIPEVVHENYIQWADETGLYPEFQIWHLGSKSRWGQADCVTRIGNFTLASGLVDPGKEELAKAFANDPNTGVSNGFYAAYTEDKKEFLAWYPWEASALPVKASANVWMNDSEVLEGEGFLLKPEHKALLMGKGVPENFLTELESDILARGTQVTQQGVASKSVEPSTASGVEGITTETLINAVGTSISTAIKTLIDRLDTLEAGQKALETKTSKSQDDLIADAILAKAGALPQGFKATESPTNIVTDPNIIQEPVDDPQFNWLGKQFDAVLAANGIGGSK